MPASRSAIASQPDVCSVALSFLLAIRLQPGFAPAFFQCAAGCGVAQAVAGGAQAFDQGVDFVGFGGE